MLENKFPWPYTLLVGLFAARTVWGLFHIIIYVPSQSGRREDSMVFNIGYFENKEILCPIMLRGKEDF